MYRTVFFALALALAATTPLLVPIAEAAPASAKARQVPWSVETAKIGQLLDNPAAKAIFVKHFPLVAKDKRLWAARGMKLRDIMKHSEGYITDAKLAAMDADLKALPPRATK